MIIVSKWFVAQLWRNLLLVLWHVLAVVGPMICWPTAGRIGAAILVYSVLMFGITAGYHRYFAHRSFRTSRVGQVVLAWLAQTALQMGVLWWAAHHREHHRSADLPADPHSPKQRGLWHAHIGWILSAESVARNDSLIADLLRFPELRWLDRMYWLPPVVWIALMAAVGGPAAVVWGFLVPALTAAHVTYTINSLAHTWGGRVYRTADTSRNNLLLAALTHGEGWHNNHHFYPGSARQGFLWWQIDVTWVVLRVLAAFRLVSDLRSPPAAVLAGRVRGEPPAA